jgi:hypothetical protein
MNRVLAFFDSILAGINAAGDKIVNLWESEPVAVSGLVTVLLDAGIAFGLPIDPDQKTAVIAVVSAIGVLIARSKVTPVTPA